MRRIVTYLLLVSIVAGNLEILTDSGCRSDTDHPPSPFAGETLVHALDASNDGRPVDEADCDHCCHGASHFTGIVAVSQRAMVQSPDPESPELIGIHDSLIFAPPLKPPTV